MSADLLKCLLEATIAISLAIALVIIARVPMRKLFGARVAYTFWCLVPLALIAVFIPAQKIVITAVSQPVAENTSPVSPASMIPVQAVDSSSDMFLLLWLIGIVVCAFVFARQQKRFIGSLGVLNLYHEKVYLSENNNHGPSVIGVVQPRIVLPSDFNQRYNQEEQDLVLTHERVHLSRGDTRINLLATILQCVFWFNPLMHWAGGRFRFDQELPTDANVLTKFPSARKSYADAMLKTQMASLGLPIACHWQSHHPLKERILMLKKSTPGKMYRVFGLCFVTALCLGGAFAAWSTQPANIIVAPAEVGLLYEIKMDLDVDGDIKKDIIIREVPGKSALITHGEGDKRWSFEFVIKPMENNRVYLKSKLERGDELISEPAMVFGIGKNAGIGVSTKDGSSIFKLNFEVRELRVGQLVPLHADDKEGNAVFTQDRSGGQNVITKDFNSMQGIEVVGNREFIALEKMKGVSAVFTQDRNGEQKVITKDFNSMQGINAASDDEIKSPAKMIASSEYIEMMQANKNAGKSAVNASLTIGAKGELLAVNVDSANVDMDPNALKKMLVLLMPLKYQAATGKQGEALVSKLPITLYGDFADAKATN